MTSRPLNVLCIHGVGHGEADPTLRPTWEAAIGAGLHHWDPDRPIVFEFLRYDDLFAEASLTPADIATAVAKLVASGVHAAVDDWMRGARGFGDFGDTLRWTAGMVAQWVENDRLRAKARDRVLAAVSAFTPDLVCAHSLGSLIGYDTFARRESAKAFEGTFVSFGSQIANPFVRSAFGGRLGPLPAGDWFHLFNPSDHVFTAPVTLGAESFHQVETVFDSPGLLNHDADRYLTHPRTVRTLWRQVAGVSLDRALAKTARAFRAAVKKPQRRALLAGINDYPDPRNRLEGCVNDVYLMSAVLQECGFEPENIRVVLDSRATLSGLLDRLAWLLEGAEDGQDRVFFYSGHGAQIPDYGRRQEVDHQDECLVPYDFDWSRERAFTDDQFHKLYSQLPYKTRFLALFDCCHSGGMTRDGGLRARGLDPPDDIRHRALRWNRSLGIWQPRVLPPINPSARRWKQRDLFGSRGQTRRLGSAALLRSQTDRAYDEARRAFGHKGPFLPVLLQACREDQLSYEYRHGATSYGAFTYAIAQTFRAARLRRRSLTWEQLVASAGRALAALSYDQQPTLVCPAKIRKEPIPWRGGR